MASSKEYLDFVLEQLSELDEVSFRAMMGDLSHKAAVYMESGPVKAEQFAEGL